MSTPPVATETSELRKATFETCLREGFTPFGQSGGAGASLSEAARRLKTNRGSLKSWLKRQEANAEIGLPHWLPNWSLFEAGASASVRPSALELVARHATRFLLTAAQDDTDVHAGFWMNLQAYAKAIGAEIRIGGFTYQKKLYEDHETRTALFRDELQPFLWHDNNDCGPVRFMAKMNTLPTAADPLSGLHTHTRGEWGVYPHAKIRLVSVPNLAGLHPAMVMTTGAVTVPNYIQKKAGQKAEFHHQLGATLVEIDNEGRKFCRQISAADDGSFQDLDAMVRDCKINRGHRVEEITWGDIHREQIDPIVAMACWGFDVETESTVSDDNMLDVLRPRHQAFHDLMDFQARNHHRRDDHWHAHRMMMAGTERVDAAAAQCARFLRQTARDWCTSVMVASNHNEAMHRWLRETDPRKDPINLRFWCQANDAVYAAQEREDAGFDPFKWALERHDGNALQDIVFVPRKDPTYLVCQAHGGIEIGLHGDEGPNGARGSAANLNKVAVRMNIGHSHTAQILDGVYQAGLCGTLDQGYNSGPSSWSHTQVVTYPNGRRSLVTIIDGKWRA
jgi:hypothetical protein